MDETVQGQADLPHLTRHPNIRCHRGDGGIFFSRPVFNARDLRECGSAHSAPRRASSYQRRRRRKEQKQRRLTTIRTVSTVDSFGALILLPPGMEPLYPIVLVALRELASSRVQRLTMNPSLPSCIHRSAPERTSLLSPDCNKLDANTQKKTKKSPLTNRNDAQTTSKK